MREDEKNKTLYGVNAKPLDPAGIAELEPHIKPIYAGGVFLADPVSVADPGAVGKAYGDFFTRRGGALVEGEARSLTVDGAGWKVATRDGWVSAPEVVVALGRVVGHGDAPAGPEAAVRRQARLPHALPAGRQRHTEPAGHRYLDRLRDEPDDARHPRDDGRGIRRARRAAKSGAGRSRRAVGARGVPDR